MKRKSENAELEKKRDATNTIKAALKRNLNQTDLLNQQKQANQITKQTLDNAMNEIVQEDEAASYIQKVLQGHKGRQKHKFERDVYPKILEQRKQQVLTAEPSNLLQYKPNVSSTNVEPPSTNVNREKYEKALLQYPPKKQDNK